MIAYLVLGLIQGLTEFLPVSSSGHLVLAEKLFGLTPPGLLCEAALHLATLAAILVAFRSDLVDLLRALTPRGSLERRKEIGFLILGTVPIAIAGVLVRKNADVWFHSLWVVAVGWLVTSGLLLAADSRARRAHATLPSAAGAVGVGVVQAAALVPGLSRSGSSIAAGILVGMRPERAARFSFLLSIPAVVGAAGWTLFDAVRGPQTTRADAGGIFLGSAVAFVVGLFALRALMRFVARHRLWPFAVYCVALAVAAVLLATFSPSATAGP